MLQVSNITLQEVEKFKYLGMVFTSDGRWKKVTDTRIGKVSAVLCELGHITEALKQCKIVSF